MTTQEKLQAIKDSLLSGAVQQRDVDGTDCRATKKISWLSLGSDRDLAESKLVDQVRMNEITESLYNL